MKFYRLVFFALLLGFVFPLVATADPLEDAKAAIENKDFSKAHALLLPLVQEENAEALTLLNALNENGQLSEDEYNKGLSVIMKTAQTGFKPARLLAFKSNLNLANQGDTSAMYNVGYMCLNDWGGEHDNNVCLKWLENAARLGHEKSSKYLAKIYADGKYGVTPDEEKVAYWNNLQASYAAGIDGLWEGSPPDTGMGGPPMVYSFDFKADGDTLTGTSLLFGAKTPITDGKFDGTNVSFAVKSDFMGKKRITNYTGTFYGDTLMLTAKTETKSSGTTNSKTIKKNAGGGDFPPITFTVKRAK